MPDMPESQIDPFLAGEVRSRIVYVESEIAAALDHIDSLVNELKAVKKQAFLSDDIDLTQKSDLVIQQMHMIQQELDYYYLISKKQAKLLAIYSKQLQKAIRLLANTSDLSNI